jgi:hypothetical protein
MHKKNPGIEDLVGVAGKRAGREALEQGAMFIAKRATSKAVSSGATVVAKGAANPAFIVGDVLEVGIESATGSRNAGRAASAAVYLGAGAAVGGPAGAAVAGGVWVVGQLIGALLD